MSDKPEVISVATPNGAAEDMPNRVVSLKMHLVEAMLIERALYRLVRDKTQFHPDCGPPDIRGLVLAVREAVKKADPEYAEMMFAALQKPEPTLSGTTIIREIHHHYPPGNYPVNPHRWVGNQM